MTVQLTRRGRVVASAFTLALLGTILPASGPGGARAYTQASEEVRPLLVQHRPVERVLAPRASRRDSKALAKWVLRSEGWGVAEWVCLERLWHRESRWKYDAKNPVSGAYGIPQKMGDISPDFAENPIVQIQWGINYIKHRYGTPCEALRFHLNNGWY